MTAKPDITVVNRSSDDRFIISACDGIWDCLSNQDAADKIASKLEKNMPDPLGFHVPCGEMLDEILAKDTETGIGTDNMTSIIIHFPTNSV